MFLHVYCIILLRRKYQMIAIYQPYYLIILIHRKIINVYQETNNGTFINNGANFQSLLDIFKSQIICRLNFMGRLI